MKSPTPNQVLVIGLAFVGLVVAWMMWRRKTTREVEDARFEGFTGLAAGAVDNAGVLEEEPYAYRTALEENARPTVDYSDIVQEGHDYVKDYESPAKEEYTTAPMERLGRLQGAELMPRVSTTVTPFAIDVANPSSHKYSVSAPAVSSLKDPNRDYSLANFIRGDVPIKMNPNVPLISRTYQGRSALRLDGLFQPGFASRYAAYTGSSTDGGAGYGSKNFVTHVVGAGSGEGAQAELVMDNF
jgi:hypothetical protein